MSSFFLSGRRGFYTAPEAMCFPGTEDTDAREGNRSGTPIVAANLQLEPSPGLEGAQLEVPYWAKTKIEKRSAQIPRQFPCVDLFSCFRVFRTRKKSQEPRGNE